MEGKTEGYVLHSAEHIFARAIQNTGLEIRVIKADTFRQDGRGLLLIEGKLPVANLFEAEKTVNENIPNNFKVSTEMFDTVRQANAKYKTLRFNEERLKEVKNIRVVKIGDFDICACKNKHVENTSEIGAFAIVNVSYLGGDTEIEFKASKDAIRYLSKINDEVIRLGQDGNFKAPDLAKNYKRISTNLSETEEELEKAFVQLMKNSQTRVIDAGELKLSRFYKALNAFVKEDPARSVILMTKTQIVGIKGAENKTDMKSIGDKLRERKAFVGDVREDYINGRILDLSEANLILSESESLIK